LPGELKGAFQRRPKGTLTHTEVLLGRGEKGEHPQAPHSAAAVWLPPDVTAMLKASACSSPAGFHRAPEHLTASA